jgi:hypothetical protein
LNDKIDTIMAVIVNDISHVDPNKVPLASLVAQEEHVDVNFIRNNNFNNSAYRNNFASNNYRPYSSTNGNGYGNSYGNSSNNTRGAPSELNVMLKDFISKQTAFNMSVEEKLGKIDVLASKVDSLDIDVELLKLKVLPYNVKESKTLNAIQVRIDERDFYFRALGSLVVLSFPQPLSFSSVLTKRLSETLTRSSNGRNPV